MNEAHLFHLGLDCKLFHSFKPFRSEYSNWHISLFGIETKITNQYWWALSKKGVKWYLFRCNFSSCSETAEIWHANSFCVKNVPVSFFSHKRGNEASNTLWKSTSPRLLPPPPSNGVKDTNAHVLVLKDWNPTMFGDSHREKKNTGTFFNTKSQHAKFQWILSNLKNRNKIGTYASLPWSPSIGEHKMCDFISGLQIAQVERRSPLLQNTEWADITLCGMCCLVSGPKEGYMYDVLTHTKLLSCYEFTCDTLSVSACHSLLHAITRQGLETYTARTYSSASEWVRAQLQRVNDQGGRKQRKRKQKVDAESKVGREHSFGGEKEDVSRNTIPSEHTPKSPGTNSEAATVEKSKEEGRMSVGRGSLLHRADGTKVMNESSPLGETTNQGTDTEKASKKTVSLTEGGEDDLRTHSAEAVGAAGQKVVGQDAVGPSGSEVDLPAAHSTSPDPAARKPPPSGEREQSVGTSPEEKSPGQDDFPLPVYDVEWLRQVCCEALKFPLLVFQQQWHWVDLCLLFQLCPPADLDICLIGMYPFPGPLFVTATEETVTLFTRASAEALQGNKTYVINDGESVFSCVWWMLVKWQTFALRSPYYAPMEQNIIQPSLYSNKPQTNLDLGLYRNWTHRECCVKLYWISPGFWRHPYHLG